MVVSHLNNSQEAPLDVKPTYCTRLEALNTAHLADFLKLIVCDAYLWLQVALISENYDWAVLAIADLFKPAQDPLKSIRLRHIKYEHDCFDLVEVVLCNLSVVFLTGRIPQHYINGFILYLNV